MLKQFAFYIKHSLNDLLVNKRLTFFALLSIAAGVAAIVSLQTLAVMIGDTLSGNLQETNRGDIHVRVSSFEDEAPPEGVEDEVLAQTSQSFVFGSFESVYITQGGLDIIRNWLTDEVGADGYEMTYKVELTDFGGIFLGSGSGTAITDVASGEQANQLSPIVIYPEQYPFYSDIVTLGGELLGDVLQETDDIVLSKQVVDGLDIEVGSTVTLNGSDAEFTVRGIVADDAEIKGPADIFNGFFAFYYIRPEAIESFDEIQRVSDVYIKLTDTTQLQSVSTAFGRRFPYLEYETTDDLSEQNEQLVGQISQLVTIMGLVSLLIGSIGIVNTMQVIVRRRTLEVAVLKTLGLKAGQVTLLFLTEAFIMGIIGSLLGIVLGWGATFIIKSAGESIIGQSLAFRIAAEPAINGFVVGVLVTTVFGFLPTLTAGQVRPGIVLRPQNTVIPSAGRLQSLGAILLVIFVLSLIAQTIMGSFTTAFAVVFGAFVASGMIFLVLSLLIWLFGRLMPSFGLVDLKVSLRQMLAMRSRNAVTLLALVIGVFSLSFITLFADSINSLLESLLTQDGNVIVAVPSPAFLPRVEGIVEQTSGVNGYDVNYTYTSTLVSVEDSETGSIYTGEDQFKDWLRSADINFPPFFDGDESEKLQIQYEVFNNNFSAMGARDVSVGSETPIVNGGRDLGPEDAGLPRLLLRESDILNSLGITPGDKITLRVNGNDEAVTFEIVGLISQNSMVGFSTSNIVAPASTLSDGFEPSSIMLMVDIDEENVAELRRELSAIPGVFALPTALINRLIASLLNTFTAFPTLVAALGLVVGGVVIANSVALTTMERRREIAVMKSIGLQRGRVLGMLLLENGILGFIGGLIGVGIGLVALVIAVTATGAPSSAIPFGSAFLLMMLCISVALIAALTTAWGASSEKPLNVLRYE